MTRMIADRRLWLTADEARVVEEGDPEAAFLLAGEGSLIPVPEVERLGLKSEDGKIVLPGARPAVDAGAGSGDEAGAPVDYASWEKEALEAEAEKRELEVKGTGANGNVLKADLVKALETADAAGE